MRFALAATEAGSGGGPDLRGGGADGVGRGGVLGAFFQTGALGAGRAGAGTPGTVIALGADGGAESTTVRSLLTANGSGFRAITSVGSSVSIESAALFAEPTGACLRCPSPEHHVCRPSEVTQLPKTMVEHAT